METTEVDPGPGGLEVPAGCELLLHHRRIPFISCPYEWCFSQLKDGARLTLELLAEAVEEGMTLCDGTPYNVQWAGARPVFIDTGSFGELLKANTRRLRALVERLQWSRGRTAWPDYGTGDSYDPEGQAGKADFMRQAAADGRRRPVWDLGCNVGVCSRLAAEHADRVVASDADPLAIERLYQRPAGEKDRRILPLVMNVAEPSPGLGWCGGERKTLAERG